MTTVVSERQVPAYTADEFAPKRADYCVCVFVINENGKLRKQLAAMRDHCAGVADIIIADGGSTDGSTDADALRDLGVNADTRICNGINGGELRFATL